MATQLTANSTPAFLPQRPKKQEPRRFATASSVPTLIGPQLPPITVDNSPNNSTVRVVDGTSNANVSVGNNPQNSTVRVIDSPNNSRVRVAGEPINGTVSNNAGANAVQASTPVAQLPGSVGQQAATQSLTNPNANLFGNVFGDGSESPTPIPGVTVEPRVNAATLNEQSTLDQELGRLSSRADEIVRQQIEAAQMTEQEKQLTEEFNRVQAFREQNVAEGLRSGETLGFARGEASEISSEFDRRLASLGTQINAFTGQREATLEALDFALNGVLAQTGIVDQINSMDGEQRAFSENVLNNIQKVLAGSRFDELTPELQTAVQQALQEAGLPPQAAQPMLDAMADASDLDRANVQSQISSRNQTASAASASASNGVSAITGATPGDLTQPANIIGMLADNIGGSNAQREINRDAILSELRSGNVKNALVQLKTRAVDDKGKEEIADGKSTVQILDKLIPIANELDFGFGGNTMRSIRSSLGLSTKEEELVTSFGAKFSAEERNRLFGAALTANENAIASQFLFSPGMFSFQGSGQARVTLSSLKAMTEMKLERQGLESLPQEQVQALIDAGLIRSIFDIIDADPNISMDEFESMSPVQSVDFTSEASSDSTQTSGDVDVELNEF